MNTLKTFKDWLEAQYSIDELESLVIQGTAKGKEGMVLYSETTRLYAMYTDEIWRVINDGAKRIPRCATISFIESSELARAICSDKTFQYALVRTAATLYARQILRDRDKAMVHSSRTREALSKDMRTVTYIARPVDNQRKWWSAILPVLDSRCLTQRVSVSIINSGRDLELTDGTLLIDSEENHPGGQSGRLVRLGFTDVESGRVHWLTASLRLKLFLKNTKGRQDLMKGGGNVAGVLRIALYLQSLKKEDQFEAFQELQKL